MSFFTQSITIMGRPGKDPKFGQPEGGKAWLRFSVAVTPKVKPADGSTERVDGTTTWFDVKAFGQTAKGGFAAIPAIKAHKGMVVVVGRLQEEEYTRDGVTTKKMVIVADIIAADSTWGLPGSPVAGNSNDSDIEARMNAEATASTSSPSTAPTTSSRFDDDDEAEL